MKTILAASLLLVFTRNANAECPASAAEVGASAEAATAAYTEFELETFAEHFGEIEAAIACVNEQIPSDVATQVHLAFALKAWLDKDRAAVTLAFQGVLAADPNFFISSDIAPEGSGIRQLYDDALDKGSGASTPLPKGTLVVDGTAGVTQLPVERRVFIQNEDDPPRTWYLAGDGIPEEVFAAAKPVKSGPNKGLLAAGAAAGIASGVSLVLASGARSDFEAAQSPAEANEAYELNRLTGLGGYALGAAAAGLMGCAFVVAF